jgi:beta-glucanase (GH16 family)
MLNQLAKLFVRAKLMCAVAAIAPFAPVAAQPLWVPVWNDEFESLDESTWQRVNSIEPTNNSLHAYLPEQVAVANGALVLTSTDEPYQHLPYRSGQVISRAAQRFGRWEVRANLPSTQGMWPAIWLLPNVDQYRWPSGGEIDIMENRGNEPTLTSSAFHYGTNPPYNHQFVYQEQQARVAGSLSNYHDGFHIYAVDWTPNYLRFYVDGVHHYTVWDEDVDGFLSQNTVPMQLVINNAIGGSFLPNPDASTQWPQTMEVDWVRVYEANGQQSAIATNTSFEDAGGTLAGWSVFGNTLRDNPNVSVASEAVHTGAHSLKIFGTFAESTTYSGVSQGISVAPGQAVEVSLQSLVRSADSIRGTDNRVVAKVEFYSEWGAKFGSAAFLGADEIVIADGAVSEDSWQSHQWTRVAPGNAVEARLAIIFIQPGRAGGAVHIDDVVFRPADSGAAIGDYNQDGLVDAADYTLWRDSLGAMDQPAIDGDGSGTVDWGDYIVWRNHFGTVASSLGSTTGVPMSRCRR